MSSGLMRTVFQQAWGRAAALIAAGLVAVAVLAPAADSSATRGPTAQSGLNLGSYTHIVVIYEENHSFDNLFGGWERVDGRPRGPVRQVDMNGRPLRCLPQNDVNLTSPPLIPRCSITLPGAIKLKSAFTVAPFAITRYLPPAARTCPDPRKPPFNALPTGVPAGQGSTGGCTRDLVHNFYQEQYQIHGGRMDRYATGSTALGLTMGYYRTRNLPLYRYLHAPNAPHYAIEDRFFHSVFGGSYLNHQWLIAARTPVWPNADRSGGPNDLHAAVGADGYPASTALHPQAPGANDGQLTQAAAADGTCLVKPGAPQPPAATVCGDYAVNTIQPPYQPYAPGTALAKRLPAQTSPTIGDRLSAGGIDWAWYSGGWDNADGNTTGAGWTNGPGPKCGDRTADAGATYPHCAAVDFQYHHQPFNYYANYAPGQPARRAHLRDETEFLAAARSGDLKPVSFVKPLGRDTEHPGYASQVIGDRHLVRLLDAIYTGPAGKDTLVVVTYDEFGGQWDHVAPPTPGHGSADQWGPGTRIPAVVISSALPRPFTVDHTPHDTTAILAEIEHHFGLAPVASRDAAAADFAGVVKTPVAEIVTAPTKLSAAPASKTSGQVSATLTRADSGAPIAGQTVVFSVRSPFGSEDTICSAVTAANGTATCTSQFPLLGTVLDAAFDDRYTASYAGATNYLAASASGPLS